MIELKRYFGHGNGHSNGNGNSIGNSIGICIGLSEIDFDSE
jgi:hypothetical protein